MGSCGACDNVKLFQDGSIVAGALLVGARPFKAEVTGFGSKGGVKFQFCKFESLLSSYFLCKHWPSLAKFTELKINGDHHPAFLEKLEAFTQYLTYNFV